MLDSDYGAFLAMARAGMRQATPHIQWFSLVFAEDSVRHDFLAALQSYLKEYGQRGEGLSLDRPSWIEDPAPVLENLKGFMALDGRDLPTEMAAMGQERERLVAEARRSLDGYPAPVRAEFEFLLAAAQQAVVLSEDHNFWIDQTGLSVERVPVRIAWVNPPADVSLRPGLSADVTVHVR